MRRVALMVAILFAAAGDARDRRCGHNRTNRFGECDSYAYFEAFPSSGAGTSGPCSATAPTGARGEVLSFARASSATCTKTATGGLATTGIADGDLVTAPSGDPRVEYDSGGKLKLLVESARTNLVLRYIEYANAAWADVGTPTLTGSQTDPFGTTTAVQFDDNDGAAYEGRSQSVTVSSGAQYTAHCLVKAGTLAEARITLDGTANTITGLSATTWSIIEVADASASGTSIALQVLNGNATTDTGTVIWGGCQVEAGGYRTSIIPTTSATVTRNAEEAYFTVAATEIQCLSATAQTGGAFLGNARVVGAWKDANNVMELYVPGPGATPLHALQTVASVSKDLTAATNVSLNALTRLVGWVIPSTTIGAIVGGTETTSSAGVQGALTGVTRIYLGKYHAITGFEINGLVGEVQADPVSTRCR